jgi:aminomethyltransferase
MKLNMTTESIVTTESSTESSEILKRTPLYAEHVKLNAKMVPFAGWEMPVQYVGLKEEHLFVRKNIGLFDVSHMGEIRVTGTKALETLQWLTTNDVAKLEAGQAQYSLLPNDKGGLVDDIIIYCMKPNEEYFVCVNASNKDKDFQWMMANNKGAKITDESGEWAQIAIQGPRAPELLDKVFKLEVSKMKAFHFIQTTYLGRPVIIASTGYTGEVGAEVFVKNDSAVALWQELLHGHQEFPTMAIGLGARDTLRTEMKYSLYGHEINDEINPIAAGLSWVIKPSAKDFMGKSIMLHQKDLGLPLTLVGFKLLDKGIPRQGYDLYDLNQNKMGQVSSGTLSPSINESIGLGYVFTSLKNIGTEFYVDIRGRKARAVVVKTPFVETSLTK